MAATVLIRPQPGGAMRAYVITTGIVFGLLTVAHVWRYVAEQHLIRDPWHVAVTIAAAALCIWSWRVLRSAGRS